MVVALVVIGLDKEPRGVQYVLDTKGVVVMATVVVVGRNVVALAGSGT